MSHRIDFEKKLTARTELPLLNKRVLFTTPRNYAGLLAQLLVLRGARPIWTPSIEIWPLDDYRQLDDALVNITRYHWIAFTSTNGIEAVCQRLRALNRPVTELKKVKLAAFKADAAALENEGLRADLTPRVGDPQGMLDDLKKLGVTGSRVLVPVPDVHGVDEPYVVPQFIKDLQEIGMEPHRIAVYRTCAVTEGLDLELDILREGLVDITVFTSSAEIFALLKLLGGDRTKINRTTVAYMGSYTARTGQREGLRQDIVPSDMTMRGLVTAIEGHFLSRSQ
ncbi:MAG: uroporphyrinogen-III synthase [Dehalococcoidia bacterium]|nr:uroporphyrinogen-III synthase [Dehalococcoidia bacterium]